MKTVLLILGVAAVLSASDFSVEPDPDNVVASRLVGEWVAHVGLSNRLWSSDKRASTDTLVFRSDPSVASQVPEQYGEFFGGKQVYQAGYMGSGEQEHPFLLITFHGNPHVVVFRERGGDPFGDAESFNLFIARARNESDDLLFVGGDFNNQPFKSYEHKGE